MQVPPESSVSSTAAADRASGPTAGAPSQTELAVIRTRLANERTLLAYHRTAFVLAGTGATVLKFFDPEIHWAVTGYALIGLGGVLLVVGLFRFRKWHRRLG